MIRRKMEKGKERFFPVDFSSIRGHFTRSSYRDIAGDKLIDGGKEE